MRRVARARGRGPSSRARVPCRDRRRRRLRASRIARHRRSRRRRRARQRHACASSTRPRARTLGTVAGLGDLSHASVVYSRDGRHALRVRARRRLDARSTCCAARIERRVAAGRQLASAARSRRTARSSPRRTTNPAASSCSTRRHARTGRRHSGRIQRAWRTLEDRRPRRCARPALRLQPLRRRRNLDRRPAPIRARPAITSFRGRRQATLRRASSRPTAAITSRGCSARTAWRSSTCGIPSAACGGSSTATATASEKLPVYKMPHLRGWAIAGRRRVPAGDRPPRSARRRHARLA